VSEDNDNKATGASEKPDDNLASIQVDPKPEKGSVEEKQLLSEISFYFSDSKISPSAFLKAVKSEKVKRFKKEDEERAQLALSGDPGGERLWALMSQANLPEAIDRWIWPVAQTQLKAAVGDDFDPLENNPVQVLQNLKKSLAPALASKDKSENKSAENWLRIGICWLVEKRSIDLWTIAEVISAIFFEDAKKAKSVVKRAIVKGRIKEFRLSIANVRLGNDIVAKAKSEFSEEKRISNNLRLRLTGAEKKIVSLEADLAALRDQLAEKDGALQNVQTQLEIERHHSGHDLSETKAGWRVLLGERVAPLLSDAIDALEIEPPAPSVALKRVKAVLKVIGEASL
jgi:rRNA maturation endonuclease Nob1